MTRTHRYWTFSDRPAGAWPDAGTFVLREAALPSPSTGQALTRTIYVSLDPYQWSYRRKGTGFSGIACHARTVAQVVDSRMPGFAPGDFVFNTNGWSEFGLMGEGVERPAYMVPRKLDPAQGKISHAVGVLGMLGLTAYAGLQVQCDPQPGETVVISAASGGVGQIAGQLARLRGVRVVGIAGSAEKCRYVREALGFDDCVSHLSPTLAADLKAACPRGIDVYFENVGGKVFDAVVPLLHAGSRMTLCGLISHYGDESGKDFVAEEHRRASAMGARVFDLWVGNFATSHHDRMLAEMGPAVASGRIIYREDIRGGMEVLPSAFQDMLEGGNFGKMLVQVGEDPTAGTGSRG